MKVSFKFATGLVLAAVLIAGTNPARAGEGGAAGSVSIRFAGTTGTIVDRLSSSVAIGKGFAAATALTETGASGTTATSAVGSGGGFVLTNANASGAAYSATAETTTATAQANSFVGGTPASLRPGTGVILP